MLDLPQDDYKVSLEVFEGPLDLLLYLIRKDEVDIYDIPIARIAAEYTEYVRLMKMLDLNLAGEFLVMAATLSYIKSRMMLPEESRPEEEEDPANEGKDPRWDLVQQLLSYKKFKDAAAALSALENQRQNSFGSSGAPLIGEEAPRGEVRLGEVGVFDLIKAFHEVLERAPVEPIGEIAPIKWRVSDKIDSILSLAANGRRIAFTELFSPESPRGEIIVTFLALLELLRLRQIVAQQDAAFTEIVLRARTDEDDDVAGLDRPVIGGADHVEQ